MVFCQKWKKLGGKQKPWVLRLLGKDLSRIACLRERTSISVVITFVFDNMYVTCEMCLFCKS